LVRIPILTVLSPLLLPSLAAAQVAGEWTVLDRLTEPLPIESWYGFSLDGEGDVDADGTPDVVVGAPLDDPGGLNDAGSIFVYSGATGALLYHFTGTVADSALGWEVATADIDLDGHADVFGTSFYGIASPNPGDYQVWSGRTGQVLLTVTKPGAVGFAEALEVVEDRDGDFIQDVLVGIPSMPVGGASYAGMVELRSGADGTVLDSWNEDDAFQNFGKSLAEIADLTGDGVGEFAIGVPGYDLLLGNEGAIQVVDGATGAVLSYFTVTFYGTFQQLGSSVSDVGDVNGDGVPDLLASANVSGVFTFSYTGRVYVFDGASQFSLILHDIPGRGGGDWFGESIAGPGDVDGDGHADFMAGAPQTSSSAAFPQRGYVEVYSGRDGTLLRAIEGDVDYLHLGGEMSLAGDINGDGDPEVLVGNDLEGWNSPGGVQAGSAWILGFDGYLRLDADTLSASGGPDVTATLDFPASEAGFPYALLLSRSGIGPTNVRGLDIPLGTDSILLAQLGGTIPPFAPNARGVLDGDGDAQVLLSPSASLAGVIGTTLNLAAASYDPVAQSGRLSTVSRRLTILP
jgi:hypothetical protein